MTTLHSMSLSDLKHLRNELMRYFSIGGVDISRKDYKRALLLQQVHAHIRQRELSKKV